MNFQTQYLLVLNVIQREIRNKTVLFLSLLTIVALIVGVYFFTGMIPEFVNQDELSSEEVLSFFNASESSLKLFLSLLGTWTSLMALFVGSGLIRGDHDSNVLNLIVTLPIRRWEYLLSRFVGGSLLVMGLYFFGGLILLSYFSFRAGELIGFGLWFKTFFPVLMTVICFTSLTLVFQLFFPALFSFVISLITVVFISQANQNIQQAGLSRFIEDIGVWQGIQLLVHFVFPPVGHWGRISGEILNGSSDIQHIIYTTGHSFIGCGLVFLFASWVFSRRDL